MSRFPSRLVRVASSVSSLQDTVDPARGPLTPPPWLPLAGQEQLASVWTFSSSEMTWCLYEFKQQADNYSRTLSCCLSYIRLLVKVWVESRSYNMMTQKFSAKNTVWRGEKITNITSTFKHGISLFVFFNFSMKFALREDPTNGKQQLLIFSTHSLSWTKASSFGRLWLWLVLSGKQMGFCCYCCCFFCTQADSLME